METNERVQCCTDRCTDYAHACIVVVNMNIDTERLITAVRLHEPLWDLGHKLYKDRDARLKAWKEICEALCPNFDEMSPTEQKNFGKNFDKNLQQRWRTARDAYTRSKTAIINTKSGSGGGDIKKKYIYYDHMRFLDKKHPVEVEDSLTANGSQANISVPNFEPQPSTSQEYTPASQPSTSQDNTSAFQPSQNNIKRKTKSKRSINKEDSDFDKQMLKMFQDNSKILQNDDMAFFTSLLPITNTFTISQKLAFRSEVLKIANMIHNGITSFSRPQSSSTIFIVTSPEYSQHATQESEQLLSNYYIDMPPVVHANVEQTD